MQNRDLAALAIAAALAGLAGCGDTQSARLYTPAELGIDMADAERCDWVEPQRCMLPLPNDFFTIDDPSTPTGRRVQFARESLPANSKGVHVDLIKLYGSMELAPLTGLADAIVDLVSTGNTLKANNLVAVEEIAQVSARLIVNQAAFKLKRAEIKPLLDDLTRAVK